MENKVIFKFNGGLGAILCNNCRKIIFSGKNLPKQLPEGPQFCCKECEEKYNKINNYDSNRSKK